MSEQSHQANEAPSPSTRVSKRANGRSVTVHGAWIQGTCAIAGALLGAASGIVLSHTPSAEGAKTLAASGKQDIEENVPARIGDACACIVVMAEIGPLDGVIVKSLNIDWSSAHFFDERYKLVWRGNGSFTRFLEMLANPDAELEPHLEVALREAILQNPALSHFSKNVLVVPSAQQLSLVILEIEGAFEDCTIFSEGKEPHELAIARHTGPRLPVTPGAKSTLVCMAENERVVLTAKDYVWSLQIDKVWNPIGNRMSPKDRRDLVRVAWSRSPRDPAMLAAGIGR